MEKVKPENTGGSWGLTDEFAKLMLRHIRPATIIDFGAGIGKYGLMAREVLGGNIRTCAVDCFEKTTDWLFESKIYNQVINCDIANWGLHPYSVKADLGIFGDVIEHLRHEEIKNLLYAIKTGELYKFLMIVLPLGHVKQGTCGGNKAEEHNL